MSTLKKCIEAHNNAIALFGLEPVPTDYVSKFGWPIHPICIAVRDLGDRELVSAVFDAACTGDKPIQNVTVAKPEDSPPMLIYGDREEWEVQFEIEVL